MYGTRWSRSSGPTTRRGSSCSWRRSVWTWRACSPSWVLSRNSSIQGWTRWRRWTLRPTRWRCGRGCRWCGRGPRDDGHGGDAAGRRPCPRLGSVFPIERDSGRRLPEVQRSSVYYWRTLGRDIGRRRRWGRRWRGQWGSEDARGGEVPVGIEGRGPRVLVRSGPRIAGGEASPLRIGAQPAPVSRRDA